MVDGDVTPEYVDIDDVNVVEVVNPSAPSSSTRQPDVHPRARRRFTYREEVVDPEDGHHQTEG